MSSRTSSGPRTSSRTPPLVLMPSTMVNCHPPIFNGVSLSRGGYVTAPINFVCPTKFSNSALLFFFFIYCVGLGVIVFFNFHTFLFSALFPVLRTALFSFGRVLVFVLSFQLGIGSNRTFLYCKCTCYKASILCFVYVTWVTFQLFY